MKTEIRKVGDSWDICMRKAFRLSGIKPGDEIVLIIKDEEIIIKKAKRVEVVT
ncbi:hypothetical protein [Methanocaldococcus sp.]